MGKWAGILSLLQEECRLRTATDKSFVSKVNNSLKDKPHFIYQRFDRKTRGSGSPAPALREGEGRGPPRAKALGHFAQSPNARALGVRALGRDGGGRSGPGREGAGAGHDEPSGRGPGGQVPGALRGGRPGRPRGPVGGRGRKGVVATGAGRGHRLWAQTLLRQGPSGRGLARGGGREGRGPVRARERRHRSTVTGAAVRVSCRGFRQASPGAQPAGNTGRVRRAPAEPPLRPLGPAEAGRAAAAGETIRACLGRRAAGRGIGGPVGVVVHHGWRRLPGAEAVRGGPQHVRPGHPAAEDERAMGRAAGPGAPGGPDQASVLKSPVLDGRAGCEEFRGLVGDGSGSGRPDRHRGSLAVRRHRPRPGDGQGLRQR